MTPAPRLAALLATYVPARAARLLALVAGAPCEEVASLSAALAARPRSERLAALAAAFSTVDRREETPQLAARRLLRERTPAAVSGPRPSRP